MKLIKKLLRISDLILCISVKSCVDSRFENSGKVREFKTSLKNLEKSGNFLILLKTSIHSSPYTISVEGNIASGKTTLLNYFAENPVIYTVSEPVDKWRNIEGDNLFEMYYNDPKRWSFVFQSYIQLTMLQNHLKQRDNSIVKLLERSVHSARHIFVENLYRSGLMAKLEYNILDEWYNWFLGNGKFSCDLIVYIRTDPDIIHRRMLERCRNEEKVIEKEYLRSIHDLYENWLNKNSDYNVGKRTKIVTIDGNSSKEDMQSKYDDLYSLFILPIIKQKEISTNKKLVSKS